MPVLADASEQIGGRGEVEYGKTIDYVHHLYDTRSKIFQFSVALNTGLLAAVFEFLSKDIAKLGMSAVGFGVMFIILMMARRSWRYLQELENYARELELTLGYSQITTTTSRMPKGLDSTYYLLVILGAFVFMWLALGVTYTLRLLELSIA